MDILISWFKPLYIIEGRDSVADPGYIGGAGFRIFRWMDWLVSLLVCIMHRQNCITEENIFSRC